MKVYVATRYKGAENKHEVEALCRAVRDAGLRDFSFVRDIEKYKKTFDDQKQLWARAYDEIGACDAFLVDVSDNPSGGRLVEAGMAYALGKTVIVIKRRGVEHKAVFDGVARTVITYDDYKDLTAQLKRFEKEQLFNTTDKSMLLAIVLTGGVAVSYFLAQLWIPLAGVGAMVYWIAVRHFIPFVRAFDRFVIFIPLIALWGGVWAWLSTMDVVYALAWAIIFWIVVLPVLRLAKFSL